ncbi:TPM domain-containing protein [Bacillus sp. Bva_UNVM-123]|uniref:TPM domain-containing protein n=1 Tax=Bacillus sp. Bva_UNVM-123 TaxID=2829798 RepID=UPI00391EFB0B
MNWKKGLLLFFIFLLILPFATTKGEAATKNSKRLVYDFAGLLNKEEIIKLEELAYKYSEKRQTDFIILTTNDTKGKDIIPYMEDFYDENALGYDKPHGNTAILTLDMKERDVYLAGFYKGKEYLDDGRLDRVRDKITPDLSNGNYYDAFKTFIITSYKYMGIKPGVNPDNPIFNLWFQILASLGFAGIVVGIMAYHSGGKVTITARTYHAADTSGVRQRRDNFIRTTTTRRKKPTNNNSGGGGSRGGFGGGISSGGHSHSGSRGKF